MDIVGLDLHKRESQLASTAPDGTITDRRIVTSRDRLTAVFGRPTEYAREGAGSAELPDLLVLKGGLHDTLQILGVGIQLALTDRRIVREQHDAPGSELARVAIAPLARST